MRSIALNQKKSVFNLVNFLDRLTAQLIRLINLISLLLLCIKVMLQFALHAEVKEYLERGVFQVNADTGHKRIVRRSAKKFIVQGK